MARNEIVGVNYVETSFRKYRQGVAVLCAIRSWREMLDTHAQYER